MRKKERGPLSHESALLTWFEPRQKKKEKFARRKQRIKKNEGGENIRKRQNLDS
jgi:hypothetical protein